jgi:hypothetical protein
MHYDNLPCAVWCLLEILVPHLRPATPALPTLNEVLVTLMGLFTEMITEMITV